MEKTWSIAIIIFVIVIMVAVYSYFKVFKKDEDEDEDDDEGGASDCDPQILYDFAHDTFRDRDLTFEEFKSLVDGQKVDEETYINIKGIYDEKKLEGDADDVTVDDYQKAIESLV